MGLLTFTYIEDEQEKGAPEEELLHERVVRADSYSNAKDFEVLQTVILRGIGGVFGLQINGMDFGSVSKGIPAESTVVGDPGTTPDGENPPESRNDPNAGVKIQGSRISMDYSKITTGTSSTKVFEIKNTGETVIETIITDTEGNEINPTNMTGKNRRISMRFSATKLSIEPHSSAFVEVIVEVTF